MGRGEDKKFGVDVSSLREITLLLTLDHPNILKAFEVTTHKDELRVVMDYHLELMEVWHDEKISTDKYKKLVCYQLLSGLNFLHKNRIFHRVMGSIFRI